MPKYYHIHRGKKSSEIDTKFINGTSLFFSKKNSNWYNIEKETSKDYGGYHEYEIYIPSSLFTASFNPTTKNKIVKISKNNIKEYYALRMKYNRGSYYFIEEMKKRNIIGIDATTDLMFNYSISGPPEGFIWKKTKDIKITHIKFVKASQIITNIK
jgi:hypothetical protein